MKKRHEYARKQTMFARAWDMNGNTDGIVHDVTITMGGIMDEWIQAACGRVAPLWERIDDGVVDCDGCKGDIDEH